MSDIVDRLRCMRVEHFGPDMPVEVPAPLLDYEAADELKRLRAELAKATERGNDLAADCNALFAAGVRKTAELASKTAELSAARESLDRLQQQWAENAPASMYKAELEAARRDAERYRWLLSELDRVDPMFSVVAKVHYDRRSSDWCNFASSRVLDSAIDAAMKEQKP